MTDFICTPGTVKCCRKIFNGDEYIIPPFLIAKVIVDIGANVGAMTVLLRDKFPDATIYAIEPSRESFSLLKKNTETLRDVHLVNVAASNYNGVATLQWGSDGRATDSLYPHYFSSFQSERVHVRRTSDLLGELGVGPISLLKIDTEGSEVPILRDLYARMEDIDTVMVEYHSDSDRLLIDNMLAGTHKLYASRADHPHRGVLTYISHQLAEDNHLNAYRIDAAL